MKTLLNRAFQSRGIVSLLYLGAYALALLIMFVINLICVGDGWRIYVYAGFFPAGLVTPFCRLTGSVPPGEWLDACIIGYSVYLPVLCAGIASKKKWIFLLFALLLVMNIGGCFCPPD